MPELARRAGRACRYQPGDGRPLEAHDHGPEDLLETTRISFADTGRACALLGLVASLLTGCGMPAAGSRAATPAPPATPASAPPPRMAAGGVLVISPPQSAPAPEEPVPPEPTAHYASLAAARDAIETMLRRAVPAGDTAIHFSREAVTFEYNWANARGHGLAVYVVVNDTTECPQDKLMDAMRAAGWVDDWTYSADGDDGTRMGLVCRQFQCVIEGSWHGWDPTDSTYVPPPGCQVTATCVPRRLDDVPGH